MLAEELAGISQDAALFMIGMKIKPYEEIAKFIEKAVSTVFCVRSAIPLSKPMVSHFYMPC
jgi:hypothetical protein